MLELGTLACHRKAIRSLAAGSVAWLSGFAFLIVTIGLFCSPLGAEESYWLRKGGTVIGECPNNTAGRDYKALNQNGQWILLTGLVTCKDVGDSYIFFLNFLRVRINPAARERINREKLDFDWLGLALYRPKNNGEAIDWLYDEAKPLNGTLARDSHDPIYFGNLSFEVSKTIVGEATKFMFYLNSHGPYYTFWLVR